MFETVSYRGWTCCCCIDTLAKGRNLGQGVHSFLRQGSANLTQTMSTAWQCWSRSGKNVLATAFSWQWIDSFFASRNHTGKQLKTSFYLFPCTIERPKTTTQVLLLSCPVCFVLLLFRCNYLLHTARLFVLFGVFITRSMSGVTEKLQNKRSVCRSETER